MYLKTLAYFILFTFYSLFALSQSDSTRVVITNVKVVDVVNGLVLENGKDIVISKDRIEYITDHQEKSGFQNQVTYDGEGKYVIPGLWDMHAHPDDPEMWRMPIESSSRDLLMPLFVLYGVTGIRDMAGDMNVIKRWKDKIAKKELLGPEIVACGPLIDGPNPMWDGSVGISDLAHVKTVVDSLVDTRSDFLKVYSLLPDSTYFELSRYAKRLNVPVVGHVPSTVTTVEASETGMKSQEHLLNLLMDCSSISQNFYEKTIDYGVIIDAVDRYVYRNELLVSTYDGKKAGTIFKTFVKNNTYHTPTISMWYKNAFFEDEVKKDSLLYGYLPRYMRTYWKPEVNDHLQRRLPKIISTKRKLVAKYKSVIGAMHSAGVKLLAGTDVGANPLCFPGIGLHNELEMLVESGLSPLEALRTATLNPARFLEREEDYGEIEEGKIADMVILDENPLDNIENTRKIYAVVRKGQLLNFEEIKNRLSNIHNLQSE